MSEMSAQLTVVEQQDFWTGQEEVSGRRFSGPRFYPFMQAHSVNLVHMLEERVRTLVAKGKLEEAMQACEAAVKQARQIEEVEKNPDSRSELSYALEVQADLHRDEGDYGVALPLFREALELISVSEDHLEPRARLRTSLGVCTDYLGQTEEAMKHYREAIEDFKSMDPPAELDIADLCNNLAYLLKEEGNVDEAETLYLEALQITHTQLGKASEQTATLCNNLGALYLGEGYYNRARDMHLMSLEGRREVFGEDHPDTAQSHANLAISLAELGDDLFAREHYQQAIASFEAAGADYADDLEVVKENFAHFEAKHPQ